MSPLAAHPPAAQELLAMPNGEPTYAALFPRALGAAIWRELVSLLALREP